MIFVFLFVFLIMKHLIHSNPNQRRSKNKKRPKNGSVITVIVAVTESKRISSSGSSVEGVSNQSGELASDCSANSSNSCWQQIKTHFHGTFHDHHNKARLSRRAAILHQKNWLSRVRHGERRRSSSGETRSCLQGNPKIDKRHSELAEETRRGKAA